MGLKNIEITKNIKKMKKVILTLAIILGLCMASYSQNGGLFGRGNETEQNTKGGLPGLPGHGETGNQPSPIGMGSALLIGFGAAYAMYKRNRK